MDDLDNVEVDCKDLAEENDILHKIEHLAKTVSQLESEKKKNEEEFGMQRAKMKELFLQKEEELKHQLVDQDKLNAENKRLQSELDDLRSQLTIATIDFQTKLEDQKSKSNDELSSLQRLISETLDELAKYEHEVKELRYINEKLTAEVNKLRGMSSNSTGADMPQLLAVPGTVISSLARTVKSQIATQLGGSDSNMSTMSSVQGPDTLEDSMRKAQEDAEMLRSVVVPLEEEIKALKDKIRIMDRELQKYHSQHRISCIDGSTPKHIALPESISDTDQNCNNEVGDLCEMSSHSSEIAGNSSPKCIANKKDLSPMIPSSETKTEVPCMMCISFENQLLNAQQKIYDLEKHIIGLERYKQELNKETTFRKEMEEAWNEKKEKYKEQVSLLQDKTKKSEETLKELHSTFGNTCEEFTHELNRLRDDRERCQTELNRLQIENDDLLGKYTKHWHQLQSEPINLPDKIEELQETALHYYEELISAKVAKEKVDDEIQQNIGLLKEQNKIIKDTRTELNKLFADVSTLFGVNNQTFKISEENSSKQMIVRDLKLLRSQIPKLAENKRKMEETISHFRTQVLSLQTELDNSERVQKDFVELSQSLQRELERIREDGTQILRWEHEEDVHECRSCNSSFSVSKRKHNCRHCGRVFCSTCLSHTVYSGPNNRPSKVCAVCHTLLVRDTAPYFSNTISHSN